MVQAGDSDRLRFRYQRISHFHRLRDARPGAQPQFHYPNNSPAQKWSPTILRRWASKNLNSAGLFNAQGFLVDNAGQPLTALVGGLVAYPTRCTMSQG
jgi:hypothetical protein